MKVIKQFLCWFAFPLTSSWRAVWLAETVRLQEAESGCFDDAVVNQRVVAEAWSGNDALTRRAVLLANDLGYQHQQEVVLDWYHRCLLVLLLLAFFLGGSTSLGFLADHNEKINLLWALLLLLGINFLAIGVWVVAMMIGRKRNSGEWLFQIVQWASGRKNSAHLVDGLLSFLQRQKATPWLASVVVHGFWLSFMSGVWLGLGVKLLTQDYGFYWGSTLLFSEHIVPVVVALGKPAAWLGLALPDADLVRATGEGVQYAELARYQWGAWLLWVVFLVGWLPRLLLLLFAMERLWQLRKPEPLPLPPEWLSVKAWFDARTTSITDARGRGASHPLVATPYEKDFNQGELVWVGYELAPHLVQQHKFEEDAKGFSQVDGRQQQVEVLSYLAALPHGARKILLICDANLTPDRGLKRFAAELRIHSEAVGLMLIATSNQEQKHMWREQVDSMQLEWVERSDWLRQE